MLTLAELVGKRKVPGVSRRDIDDGVGALTTTDSFIEEVTEEVRRDRLFGYFRRYGWIAAVLVTLLVGGAAWNEYAKAKERAAAQERGDAILVALDADDGPARLEALEAIGRSGPSAPVVAMLLSAEAMEAEDSAAAIEALKGVVEDDTRPGLYRDLATLKLAILSASETGPADRVAMLEPLTSAGSPFRVFALEQLALAEIESGETGAALERLRALVEDSEAGAGLRQRVETLIVALGGDADPG